MYRKIYNLFINLRKELRHRGSCLECSCGGFDNPNYPDDQYCKCGHHYDRHEY